MPSVPGFMKPHLSFAPVNVKFPQPRFVPTGSIQATPRTISGGIEGGIAKALSALGVNEKKSAQFAQRAMAPLTDVTPVGNAIGAEEGVGLLSRGISKGDVRTGALGLGSLLLSILPYGGKAKKPLKSLLADTSGAIRAWHGSPHDFDRFDMSKIGTGEGAQAYGHGLYFAESPSTAEYYRTSLAGHGRKFKIDGENFEKIDDLPTARRAYEKLRPDLSPLNQIDPRAARAAEGLGPVALGGVMRDARWQDGSLEEIMSGLSAKYRAEGNSLTEARDKIEKLNRAIIAEEMAKRGSMARAGHTYEVNINAEPEDFLDWDAPFPKQPQSVRDVLIEAGHARPTTGLGGEPIYKGMADGIYHANDTGNYRTQGLGRSGASESLRGMGIPGIRYLDQGSRNALGNLTHNYVVFDDSLIDILNKF